MPHEDFTGSQLKPTWPHAPPHWLHDSGIYMVTASTYLQQRVFATAQDRDLLLSVLLQNLRDGDWEVRAWAVFPNHYHFLAHSPAREDGATSLPRVISRLHMQSAKLINQRYEVRGRKVWQNYWDSRITFEKSYLARLRYVNRNPEHHGYPRPAELYRWCSASWFAQTAPRAFVRTVDSFKVDRIQVRDIECSLETE